MTLPPHRFATPSVGDELQLVKPIWLERPDGTRQNIPTTVRGIVVSVKRDTPVITACFRVDGLNISALLMQHAYRLMVYSFKCGEYVVNVNDRTNNTGLYRRVRFEVTDAVVNPYCRVTSEVSRPERSRKWIGTVNWSGMGDVAVRCAATYANMLLVTIQLIGFELDYRKSMQGRKKRAVSR